MKKKIIVLILISALLLGTLYIMSKIEKDKMQKFSGVITKEELLDNLSKYQEKYQGIQNGGDVIGMLSELTMIIPNKYIQKKASVPTVLYQEENILEVKYENDLDKYINSLNDIIKLIDKEKNYNISIKCNSKGYPTEIIIEKAVSYNLDNVDLSNLEQYIGEKIKNEKAIEMLNIIKEEYNMYLSNATETGEKNSVGLIIYFSDNIEKNSDEITKNAIIDLINSYIETREYDKDYGYFNISTGIDSNNEQYIKIYKNGD